MSTLLLASASPARLAILRAAGIDPLVEVSDVDEPAVLRELAAARRDPGPVAAADQVLALARAKARAVARRPVAAAADVVVGCDSMLEMPDTEVVGKPADAAEAVARWRRMRGGSGVLHTGHWLVRPRDGAEVGGTASTTVHFADVSDAEIEAYVRTGEPLVVAGAFTVDGLGGPFVDGVEGDHHNVVGLSLPLLRRLLADLGLTIVDFWRPGADA